MLSKVVDSEKGELENQYNGLGFRVATTRPEERIEYLCDLSRDCYNMLERTVNGETESFIYDKNVISMSKAGDNYYYLQDELGSPMYMTGTDGAAVSSYAFDDFGRSIDPFTGKIKEAGNKQHTKHAYTTEGNIIQPFAFTGYQEDDISGLKFAQARFYNAKAGRFQSEDIFKGFKNAPYTLNHYSYCFGNPVGFSDKNGKLPGWMEDAWDTACDAWDSTCEVVGDGMDAAADFCADTYNGVKTWVKDNTDFVDVNELSSDKGLMGPYVTETITTKTGSTKLFTLTTKNGAFSSFGVNLPEINIFGYDCKTSFSVGSDGLSNTTTVKHTGDDGSTDSITVKTSAASISGETASTNGDNTTGSGFRLSLNPTKSNDTKTSHTKKVCRTLKNQYFS